MPIKSIAIDLDDTLIDTTHLLVPAAAKAACQKMIELGLQAPLQECLDMRKKLAQEMSHKKIFIEIAKKYKASNEVEIAKAALDVFHQAPIPKTLPLIDGAKELLEYLKPKYRLFLVTAGLRQTQQAKVAAAKVSSWFEEVFVRDTFNLNEHKEGAFQIIIEKTKIQPSELLSLGNRLSQEIRQAKKLGAQTCYFAFGEHVGEKPQCPEDHPDFTVYDLKSVIKTCGL